ncbi:MAG: T9SS C-terminal target domain-containing protein [Ignavibacteriae bacterium]|nr:MAG: T9SS C-terminal target domain-containing protein [Ignavibacteriota bacterium]
MKAFIKFVAASFLITSALFSQVVGEQWVSRYNGSANTFDGANCLTIDNAGNVYTAGSSYQTGTSRDMLTIKITPLGDTAWVRKYNGSINGGDYIFAIAVDNSGNVYVTGRCDNGTNSTFCDYTTIKYNSSGVQLWVALYNGTANGVDEANVIAVDASGNVYVTGRSPGTGTDLDIVTVKYNSSGVEQWVKRFNGTLNAYDYPYAMTLTPTGDVAIAGMTINNGTGSDFTVIKYDTDGNLLWSRTYNNPTVNGGDFARAIECDQAGNIVACGYIDNGPVYKYDFLTVKYNPSGVLQWHAFYNNSSNVTELAYDLSLDNAGNVYVTGGGIGAVAAEDSNFITVKYNSSGAMQWVAFYDGPMGMVDIARSVMVDGSGNIYVTGASGTLSGDDYATIKYNPSGVQQWVKRYNGPGNGNDYTNSIAVNHYGEVFVTGRSLGVGTDYDFATIKYSPFVGIEPVNNEIPGTYYLRQNYPNPFNPETVIKFNIPREGNVNLTVYDINGRTVSTLINGNLKVGRYNYNFNASNLTSGIYFYTLTAGTFSETKKMILLK